MNAQNPSLRPNSFDAQKAEHRHIIKQEIWVDKVEYINEETTILPRRPKNPLVSTALAVVSLLLCAILVMAYYVIEVHIIPQSDFIFIVKMLVIGGAWISLATPLAYFSITGE